MTKSGQSGAAASSLPQCKYFEQMKFLHEKTSSTLADTCKLPNLTQSTTGATKRKGSEMLFPPSSSWQCGGPFGW